VASKVLGQTCCPPEGFEFDPGVNRPLRLEPALEPPMLIRGVPEQKTLSMDEVEDEIIDRQRVVCAGLQYPVGNWHFIISGFGQPNGVNSFWVNDPLDGTSGWVSEDDLLSDYRGLGAQWMYTYYTRM
jgi:hypothetical protein